MTIIRVKMITLSANEHGVFLPGKEYGPEDGMPQELMADLCDNGYAEAVKTPVKQKQEMETATVKVPEKAVLFDIPGVDPGVVAAIAARGITPETLAETPDNVLSKIPGVGKATLAKIRAWSDEVKANVSPGE